MYTFPQQQKIFKQLLTSNPSNKQCADCNTIGPTWASLNFGVFLCSNCSGAHRALGPTITRVKSTKLDQWQKQWMQCMQIGNKQLNEYWQAQLGMTKKPKMGAGQPQLLKYATQKYVKKRFVSSDNQDDPLAQYKNGTYHKKSNRNQQQNNKQPHYINKNQKSNQSVNNNSSNSNANNSSFQQVKSNVAVDKSNKGNSGNLNLLEFDILEDDKKNQTLSQLGKETGQNNHHFNKGISFFTKQKSQNNQPIFHKNNHHTDEQFSQYTQHGTSVTNNTNQKSHLTFDQLFSNKKSDDSFSGGQNGKYMMPTLQHTQSASTMIGGGYGNNNGQSHNLNWGNAHTNMLGNTQFQHTQGLNYGINQNIGTYNPNAILGHQTHTNINMNMNSLQYQQPHNRIIQQQQVNSNLYQPYHSININNHTYNQYDKSSYLSSGSAGISNNQMGYNNNSTGTISSMGNLNMNMNNQINLNMNMGQQSSHQNNSNNNNSGNWLDSWK